eukprot:Amastigsp_a676875_118.p4 type:complete len:133 gc:universal Amastigsp_a676875_118:545-147(-)
MPSRTSRSESTSKDEYGMLVLSRSLTSFFVNPHVGFAGVPERNAITFDDWTRARSRSSSGTAGAADARGRFECFRIAATSAAAFAPSTRSIKPPAWKKRNVGTATISYCSEASTSSSASTLNTCSDALSSHA